MVENGVVVGRIFKVPVAPPDRPWMWASGHSADSIKRAAHGYEPTREGAIAAFTKSWRAGCMSEEPVDLRGFAMSIALTSDFLKAILSAIDDPRLDCEETIQVIKENTLKAQEHVELMRQALEPAPEDK